MSLNASPSIRAPTLTVRPVDAPTFAALAAGLLAEQRRIRYRATGASMRPTIRDGDVLTVAPLRPHGLRRGDVVFYRALGGGLRAHRLLGWRRTPEGTWACIRGDASCGPPEWIPETDLLGRVISRIRDGRSRQLDAPGSRGLGLLRAIRQSLRGLWRQRPRHQEGRDP